MKLFGEGAKLLEQGWLTERAAARSLGITVNELVARAKARRIARKSVGPGVFLYDVVGGAETN